jgi:hypothetical protein
MLIPDLTPIIRVPVAPEWQYVDIYGEFTATVPGETRYYCKSWNREGTAAIYIHEALSAERIFIIQRGAQ